MEANVAERAFGGHPFRHFSPRVGTEIRQFPLGE